MAGTPVELIKEKLDIVEFLKGYLQLQPAGKNFKALCPFHKEKTPSFMISPDRQSWHCFGCALGGDAFAFLMRYENIEFGEALRVLAEKTGVELKRINPAEYKLSGALFDVNAGARDFFRAELVRAPKVQEYLRERKLEARTVEQFELGWAPPDPEALTLHLIKLGHSSEEIIHAGLALRTERGMILDRFRGRVMFPIHNHFGKVAGFTGRVLPHEGPEPSEGASIKSSTDSGFTVAKYVNTPETPIFQKSKLLYGFWMTKNAIREVKSAFLVEGQMDCLMSWQTGVANVVASSGTALTGEHLKTLHRVAEELVFSFDNDEAGSAAGERAINLAQAEDFHVKVVMLKGVKDPAEAAAADPVALKNAVQEAKPAALFYFEKYLAGVSDFGDREGLTRLRAVLRKIMNIMSAVSREHWLKELSRRTTLEVGTLKEEAQKLSASVKEPLNAKANVPGAEGEPERLPAGQAGAKNRLDLLSERVLAFGIAKADFSTAEACVDFFPPLYARAMGLLKEGKKESGDPEMDAVLERIFFRGEYAGFVSLEHSVEPKAEEEDVQELQQELAKEYFRRRRETLTRAVRLAESRGDEHAVANALEELQKIPNSA